MSKKTKKFKKITSTTDKIFQNIFLIPRNIKESKKTERNLSSF